MSLTFCIETGKLKRASDKPRPLKRPPRWQLIRALFPTPRTVAVADWEWPELLSTPLFERLHGGVDPRPGAGARDRLKRLFAELLESDDRAAQRAACRIVLKFEADRQLAVFGYRLGVGKRGVRELIEEYLDEVLGDEPSADVWKARGAGS